MYKRLAKIILIVIGCLTALALMQFPNIRFSYDFESFFPTNDEDLVFYEEFKKTFGTDNDFILIAIENQNGVFNQQFLKKVDQLANEFKEVSFIKDVNTPTQMKQFRSGPFGPVFFDLLHLNDNEKLKNDSARIFKNGYWTGRYFADNGKSVLISLKTNPGLSKLKSDSVVNSINKLIEAHTFDKVYRSGRVFGQHYYIQKMESEMVLFLAISSVLLILFLVIAFKSLWGVLIPMMVVFLTVIWQLGIMTFLGQPLDLLSMLLPSILFVVGISDVIHIINRYLEELRKGEEKEMAVKTAFIQVGAATFLTSLTTAIGFLTLVVADIIPIQNFGWQTAVGVWLAFILAFTFLPAILILIPKPRIAHTPNEQNFWTSSMTNIYHFVLNNSKMIVGIATLFCVLSIWGISYLKVDNYFLEDLSKDDPHRKEFEYFEEHYSGVRPFDLIVINNEKEDFLKLENLHELEKIEQLIQQHYPVKFVQSPLFLLKYINQSVEGGRKDAFTLPTTKAQYKKVKKLLKSSKIRQLMKHYIDEDAQMFRFSCRIKDVGGHEMGKRNNLFLQDLKKLNQPEFDYKLTGMSMLIDKNNETLAMTMMEGLVVAFALIALLMGWLFRSLPMVVITLVPNILPLIGIAAFMGFTGIDLKVSTSIIFTIAFGIAVDDTIHYVSKLRMELKKGRSLPYAMKRTGISTGKAIVVTSIILISGFISLIFSTFASTFYIGLLVSITLLLAVLSDLFLLPALIIVFYRKKK